MRHQGGEPDQRSDEARRDRRDRIEGPIADEIVGQAPGRGLEARRVVALTGASGPLGAALLRRLRSDPRCHRVLALTDPPGFGQPPRRWWRRSDLSERPAQPPQRSAMAAAAARSRHPAPEPATSPRSTAVNDRVEIHQLDLTRSAAGEVLQRLLIEAQVDAVIHAAFLPQPARPQDQQRAHEIESIGTLNLLNACAGAAVRKVVLWSQSLVYGPDPHNPNYLTEDHALRAAPQTAYLADRLDVERQARAFAQAHPEVAVTVLRTATLLGAGVKSYGSALLSLPVCPKLLGRDPLVQLLHPDDAVAAFVHALHSPAQGAFNIAGRGVLPYSTVLAMLGRLPLPLPCALAYPLLRALWATGLSATPPEFLDLLRYLCVMDISKAERELGFRPRYDIQRVLREFSGAAGITRAASVA